MNIVQLLSQIELTGAEVHAVKLAEGLMKEAHKCYLISDELHINTSIPFTPLAIHRAKFFTRWKSVLKLRKFINSEQIQVVHAHSRAAVRIAFWATLGTNCALVSTLHGRQHYSISKKIFNTYGQALIAVCENIKQQMINDFKIIESKIKVIRNFFDFEEVKNLAMTLNVIPSPSTIQLQKTQKMPIKVAFLGRTTGPKGENWGYIINNLIPKLLQTYPTCEFHFAGGPVQALSVATKENIQLFTNQFPSRFFFHGHLASLLPLIQESQIIVGAGRIAIEGLILNKSVIALGEQSYEGIITSENWQSCLASNFGDILPGKETQINFDQLFKDLSEQIQLLQPITNTSNSPNLEMSLPNSFIFPIEEKLELEFSEKKNLKKIYAVYQSAIFKKNYPKNIPILMYHQVVADESFSSPHKIYITTKNFETHLRYLQENNFSTITFEDLYKYKTGENNLKKFPKKPIIITFDDGYTNNLTLALPLLKKYNFKAVFYLLATLHKTNYWDKHSGAPELTLMSADERQLLAKEMEIGSHGFDHKKLSTMSENEAYHEIYQSKIQLEKEFNRPIYSYAYTYGVRHPLSSEMAQRAGYHYAVNTTTGGFHHEDDPFSLFRVSIFPTDNPSSLNRKTSSWYRKYYYLKRKE